MCVFDDDIFLYTGGLILLSLALLLPYCYYIPKSALAAVIIMAVMQMVDYKIIPILWRTNSECSDEFRRLLHETLSEDSCQMQGFQVGQPPEFQRNAC